MKSVRIQQLRRNEEYPKRNLSTFSNEKQVSESIYPSKSQSLPGPTLQIKSHMDVFNAAKYLESIGQKIIHMEVGEPDFPPPVAVKLGLEQVFEKHRIHYTQAEGISALRDSLSKYISNFSTNDEKSKKMAINPGNIIVTPGGRFGIFALFSSILQPGDEIIIIEPAWPACLDCANYLGVKTRCVRTFLDNDWEPDLTQLETQININTKVICLNYPNNPTGKILSNNTLEAIVNLASKNGIYLLSDEVYSNYRFKPFRSVIDFEYEKSILINSFSKTFAMTGFRVGFLHTLDKSLVNKLKKFQALALTSVAEPMQFCALKALESEAEDNRLNIEKRIGIVCNALKNLPFEFNKPDGAMYVFAKMKIDLKSNDLQLVENLLRNGVAVAPGSGFGSNYSNFIRISTCINEENIQIGMEKIAKTIENL